MRATFKHATTGNIDRRGFTIVELLIVIVVIGILAAITIVAYQGMQQRATTVSYTAAVDQWEKIVRMEKSLQGDDFASYGRTCVGRSMSDFPETSDFAEGQCVKNSIGTSFTYNEEVFEGWKVDRPNTALPTTTFTHSSGIWAKTRGIILSTRPADFVPTATLEWVPQVAGQCGRGVDQSHLLGIEDGALTGGSCVLNIQ